MTARPERSRGARLAWVRFDGDDKLTPVFWAHLDRVAERADPPRRWTP